MPKITTIANRILLFKPMKDLCYIRKNGGNYAFFHTMCSVSKDNKVITMALDWVRLIKHFKALGEYEKSVLGNKKCEKADPEDKYYIYAITKPLKLTNPVILEKPVRGLRFATESENYEIRKEIIKGLAEYYNISLEDMFWNWGNYPELYRNSWELDFQSVLFDLEKTGELYEYNKIKKEDYNHKLNFYQNTKQSKLY